MRPCVILDRDGVINQDSPEYIKSPEEWLPLPGALEAIALLGHRGVDVYVVTNQAGIGRGLLSLAALEKIHTKMRRAVIAAGGEIKDLRFCPHHPDDRCACRKPRIGMLEHLAEAHGIDLPRSPLVGDSLTDLEAAEAAGCTPVLVLTGRGKATLEQRPEQPLVFPDLLAFARHTVAGRNVTQ